MDNKDHKVHYVEPISRTRLIVLGISALVSMFMMICGLVTSFVVSSVLYSKYVDYEIECEHNCTTHIRVAKTGAMFGTVYAIVFVFQSMFIPISCLIVNCLIASLRLNKKMGSWVCGSLLVSCPVCIWWLVFISAIYLYMGKAPSMYLDVRWYMGLIIGESILCGVGIVVILLMCIFIPCNSLVQKVIYQYRKKRTGVQPHIASQDEP